MALRGSTLALLVLLAAVQGSLWLGRGSLPHVWSLQRQLDAQQAGNEALRTRNRAVSAEVADLKEGLEMVEE
ncbi:MAG: septum formation initiator family protein, partial [Rubrivivax sp.]